MIALLEENGFQLSANEEKLYNFIISISIGEKKFEEIVEWLKKNTEQKIP
jgi:prophage maintenance system killer protein